MNKKGILIIIILLIGVLLAGVILYKTCIKKCKYEYEKTDKIMYNPMMGFAPSADYINAVGDNKLVYIQLTWREIEPEENVFDYEGIIKKYNLERWKSEGKKAVLRIVCDIPGESTHMDIPDWLYEKTSDGFFYDNEYGKGYSPNYENSVFMQYHHEMLRKMGDKFGQDNFISYIELGSLGHWGEWHIRSNEGESLFLSEENCSSYVKDYEECFPNAYLLMRRPFSFVKDDKLGVYNDMTGDMKDTKEWLSWITDGGLYKTSNSEMVLNKVPEIWKIAPIGGEFSSGNVMKTYLTDKLDETLELLDESHMTFIGPNCPIANIELKDYPDSVKEMLNHVGYRYGVTNCVITDNKISKTVSVKLEIKNYGVAPMYQDWPIYMYFYDQDGNYAGKEKLDCSLKEIQGKESKIVKVNYSYKTATQQFPIIAVGIENPDNEQNEVEMDMEVKTDSGRYYLNYEY